MKHLYAYENKNAGGNAMTTDPKPYASHHNEDVEVESDEKQDGEPIEVNEERLPSRAMATHEEIRQEGEKSWSAMPLLFCGQR
jgi:hypothetical protein